MIQFELLLSDEQQEHLAEKLHYALELKRPIKIVSKEGSISMVTVVAAAHGEGYEYHADGSIRHWVPS